MTNIIKRHGLLYSSEQTTTLYRLIATMYDLPIFITDVHPNADWFPLFKTEEYPVLDGGDHHFNVGIEVRRKFFGVFQYTTISPLGKISWTFDGDTLASLSIQVDDPEMQHNFTKELSATVDALQKVFGITIKMHQAIGGHATYV
ncbi:MAG: hypothetical protein ABIO57_01090 [Candidatus Paceibacterota bacterium]